MPSKSSMLQRALKFNAEEITGLHENIESCKINLKAWQEECADIFGDLAEPDRQYIKDCRKRIKQLAELQVFLKRELQQTYFIEQIEARWHDVKDVGNECVDGFSHNSDFRHNPKFMTEAPPVELGSFVGDENA